MSVYIQVTTAIDSVELAKHLQEMLLQQRLAACVQLSGPVESQYWWNGILETTLEWVLTLKTTQAFYTRIESLLLAHHPYTTPEILVTPILQGNLAYLEWIDSELEQI